MKTSSSFKVGCYIFKNVLIETFRVIDLRTMQNIKVKTWFFAIGLGKFGLTFSRGNFQ